jgi:hypothetical protein
MIAFVLAVVLWGLLAAIALKYVPISRTLHPYDRIGAAVFFTVVGLPVFITGMALVLEGAAVGPAA